jgi:alkylation response protein AidB-like acyl-CoA dehydrogenase
MLLARTPNAPAGAAGISLFLVPYLLPDGTRNDVELVRLKEMMIAAPLMR